MAEINKIESLVPCSGSYSPKKDLRLNAWLFAAVVDYLVILWLLKHHPEWTSLSRGLLTLTPLIPGVLYLRSCMRFIRGMDELQRRIQLEAWLFAALGALIISTAINTLNASGALPPGLKDGLGVWSTFSLTFALWLVGGAIANRRYR
jgi:hypothetical protein